jgi:hypothetical protein
VLNVLVLSDLFIDEVSGLCNPLGRIFSYRDKRDCIFVALLEVSTDLKVFGELFSDLFA